MRGVRPVPAEPTVGVVIPVHDGERYLAEAIESVLAQTHRQIDVIVVDDGSSDDSAAVAESYAPRVRCFSQEAAAGIGAARNRGVEMARGAYLAFLDADDLWERRKLELQLRAFELEPRPDLVFGRMRQFKSPDLDDATATRIRCPDGLQPGYLPSGLLAAREAFERVGPFATGLRVGEFIDWMARARELGLCEVVLPDHVLWRRLHGSNQGVRHRRDIADFAHVLKASLDRRRAAGAR
jgi:glycosyltransferase involved in cell wall biosynthesis